MKHTIRLTTTYDKPNVNGFTYSKEEIEKAIISEEFVELLNSGLMYIEPGSITKMKSSEDILTIKPEDIVGTVLSVDLDQGTAEIDIKEKKFKSFYPDDNIEDLSLGMKYLANKIDDKKNVHIIKIAGYMLIKED